MTATPKRAPKVYVIGSLRNPQIPIIAEKLREEGFDVFDDWYSAGPEADDHWKAYEQARGHSYDEALQGYPAHHVYEFDKAHLDTADAAVMVLPAGRSGHLELGYMIGCVKPGFILLDESEDRWDVMYLFATGIERSLEGVVAGLKLSLGMT